MNLDQNYYDRYLAIRLWENDASKRFVNINLNIDINIETVILYIYSSDFRRTKDKSFIIEYNNLSHKQIIDKLESYLKLLAFT